MKTCLRLALVMGIGLGGLGLHRRVRLGHAAKQT